MKLLNAIITTALLIESGFIFHKLWRTMTHKEQHS